MPDKSHLWSAPFRAKNKLLSSESNEDEERADHDPVLNVTFLFCPFLLSTYWNRWSGGRWSLLITTDTEQPTLWAWGEARSNWGSQVGSGGGGTIAVRRVLDYSLAARTHARTASHPSFRITGRPPLVLRRGRRTSLGRQKFDYRRPERNLRNRLRYRPKGYSEVLFPP